MDIIRTVWSAALGVAIGSFANAYVWRFGRSLSVRKGRSRCVHCAHDLRWYDLLPVVSFVLLRGRCRYCRRPIPWHYPIVELGTATVFVLIGGTFAQPLTVVVAWTLAVILVLLFLIDLRYRVLPDNLTVPGILVGFCFGALMGRTFVDLLLGGILGMGVFLFQYLASRGKWIGGGDVRLGALMGMALGVHLTLLALVLAYVAGAVVGVALIGFRRATWGSQIPFGTFLTAATLIIMLWGERVWQWYSTGLGF